jgi:hypothetical protein
MARTFRKKCRDPTSKSQELYREAAAFDKCHPALEERQQLERLALLLGH